VLTGFPKLLAGFENMTHRISTGWLGRALYYLSPNCRALFMAPYSFPPSITRKPPSTIRRGLVRAIGCGY
jgi:hypothetical protein